MDHGRRQVGGLPTVVNPKAETREETKWSEIGKVRYLKAEHGLIYSVICDTARMPTGELLQQELLGSEWRPFTHRIRK